MQSDTRRRKRYAKSDLVNEGLHLPVKRNSLWLLVFWKGFGWEELWSGVISTFAQRLNWLFYVLWFCQVRFCVAFSSCRYKSGGWLADTAPPHHITVRYRDRSRPRKICTGAVIANQRRVFSARNVWRRFYVTNFPLQILFHCYKKTHINQESDTLRVSTTVFYTLTNEHSNGTSH